MERFFADEVGAIVIRDGIVRIDLITYPPASVDTEGNPAPVFTQRILMTIGDLMRSYESMRKVVQKLVDDGVLVLGNGAEAPPQGGNGASGVTVSTDKVRSPNFPGSMPEE